MAELWYHQSVSPAPGKDVKEERGSGGQDGLEKSLRPQQGKPSRSHANRACFALGLLLHPKEWAVAGHLGDGRDTDKE